MGFTHIPGHVAAPKGARGKFVSIGSTKGVPQRINFSRDLAEVAGIEKGTEVDIFVKGAHIAFVIGDGGLLATKCAASFGVRCPALLEKLKVKAGDRFSADVKAGVVFSRLSEDGAKAGDEDEDAE